MLYQLFRIGVFDTDEDTQALNHFLQSNRIVSVDRQFVADGQNSFWSFCVAWEGGDSASSQPQKRGKRPAVDYRELLSPEVFTIYARLRSYRNQLAEKMGTPAYAIFTNEQLAQMAQIEQPTISALSRIEGVGEKRMGLYGEQFLAVLKGEHG